MASAAVKITPMATSVVIVALFCNCQIRTVPSSNAMAAPTSGLTLSNIATPSPGRAMCETTSPARLIRFMSAKLPTSPAASAVSRTRMTEYVSEVVTSELERAVCSGEFDFVSYGDQPPATAGGSDFR